MAFKDMFRPKWKHSDAEIRLQAIEKLEDQKILAEVAKNDESPEVRKAAVFRLDNQALLTEISKQSRDIEVRKLVPNNIYDQEILAEIAINDESPEVRNIAQTRINTLIRLNEWFKQKHSNNSNPLLECSYLPGLINPNSIIIHPLKSSDAFEKQQMPFAEWKRAILSNPWRIYHTIVDVKYLGIVIDRLTSEVESRYDLTRLDTINIINIYVGAVCPKCLASLSGEWIQMWAELLNAKAITKQPKRDLEIDDMLIDRDRKRFDEYEKRANRVIKGQCGFCGSSNEYYVFWLGAQQIQSKEQKQKSGNAKPFNSIGEKAETCESYLCPSLCEILDTDDAISRGFVDIGKFEQSLEGGSNVNERWKGPQNTPLHLSVIISTKNPTIGLQIVELLCKHGADVNAQNARGFTPLHFAVQNQLISIAKILLQCGALPNISSKEGDTPMTLASSEMASIIKDHSQQKVNQDEFGGGADREKFLSLVGISGNRSSIFVHNIGNNGYKLLDGEMIDNTHYAQRYSNGRCQIRVATDPSDQIYFLSFTDEKGIEDLLIKDGEKP